MSFTKNYINDQIELIDDKNKNECLESLYTERQYLFNYDDIIDNNSNLNHNIEKF